MTAEEQSPLRLRQDSVWLSCSCTDQGRGGKLKYQCDNSAESDKSQKVPFSSLVRRIEKMLCVLGLRVALCVPHILLLMTFNLEEPSRGTAQTEAVDHTLLPRHVLVKAKFLRAVSIFRLSMCKSVSRGEMLQRLHIYCQITRQ